MNFLKGVITFILGGLTSYYGFITPMPSDFFKNSYIEICDLIFTNYYQDIKGFPEWHDECLEKTKEFPRGFQTQKFIKNVESIFLDFQTSHLSLWVPNDVRVFWKGVSKDTGLRVRNIEGAFIIHEIIEGSSAQVSGFRLGDEILEINGNTIQDEQEVKYQKGTYLVLRDRELLQLKVVPRELFFDKRPVYFLINKETGYLRIPSFMALSFKDENYIRKTMRATNKTSQLIVDIRGNTGGDFGAMLRALSFIICDFESIGVIKQPRYETKGKKQFPDSLNSLEQLSLMEERVEIDLIPFKGYGCFNGSIVLLIDRHSASVAEIFAYTLKQRMGATVIGERSAGEVVLAILKSLQLGTGYSLSIPHATFIDPNGHQIEGIGVQPHKEGVYRINEARLGMDSYIKDAVEIFKLQSL